MSYFSYHKAIKKLLKNQKLIGWYFTENHNGIRPALVLLFSDIVHPVMPIRSHRWGEYLPLLPRELYKNNQT